jgi:hypothetical protein
VVSDQNEKNRLNHFVTYKAQKDLLQLFGQSTVIGDGINYLLNLITQESRQNARMFAEKKPETASPRLS